VSISRAIQAPKPDYNEPPEDYLDTISKELILDPVKLSCNHTFDKLPITKWLRQSQNRQEVNCPLCKRKVTNSTPNKELEKKIKKWVKENKFGHLYQKAKDEQKQEYREYLNKDIIPKPDEILMPEIDPLTMAILNGALNPLLDFGQAIGDLGQAIANDFMGVLDQFTADDLPLDPLQQIRNLIDQRRLEEAVDESLQLDQQRNQGLELIVKAYINLNELNKALETADLIDNAIIKNQQYELIAKAYIANDNFETAGTIASTLPNYNKNIIYKTIAKKYIDNNNYIKAKETIRLINNYFTKDQTYYSLAEYLLEKNQFKISLEFANLISEFNSSTEHLYKKIIEKYIASNKWNNIFDFSKTMKSKNIEFYILNKLETKSSYPKIIKQLFNLNLSSYSMFEKIKITFTFFYLLSFSMIKEVYKKTMDYINKVYIVTSKFFKYLKIRILAPYKK
jgi:hypothetical protein